MCQRDVMEIFRAIPFLQELTDEELQDLAEVAQVKKYPAETIIFREGDDLGQVFLVVEGAVALDVQVSEHGGKRIHTAGAGELVGWSPLLGQRHMTATARSMSPVWLIAFNVHEALALGNNAPRLGFTLMREAAEALAARFNTARRQVADDGYYHEPAYIAGMHEGAD